MSSIICGLLLGSICVKTGLLPSKKETFIVEKEILWKIVWDERNKEVNLERTEYNM